MVNVIKGSAGQGQVELFTFFVISISPKTLKCYNESVSLQLNKTENFIQTILLIVIHNHHKREVFFSRWYSELGVQYKPASTNAKTFKRYSQDILKLLLWCIFFMITRKCIVYPWRCIHISVSFSTTIDHWALILNWPGKCFQIEPCLPNTSIKFSSQGVWVAKGLLQHPE